jgi:CheY-like chemotaxis protein
MKVLIVEDEDPKLSALRSFVTQRYVSWEISVARSVRSATDMLRTQQPDLLILDMSLPTFDIVEGEPGGRPQGFGGVEVLRYLEMLEMSVPVVVVTGYEGFTKDGKTIDLSGLTVELTSEFSPNFRGAVQFNTVSGEWVAELQRLINLALEGKQ